MPINLWLLSFLEIPNRLFFFFASRIPSPKVARMLRGMWMGRHTRPSSRQLADSLGFCPVFQSKCSKIGVRSHKSYWTFLFVNDFDFAEDGSFMLAIKNNEESYFY